MGYPKSTTDVEPVVKGVDLVVERGEIRGPVGESGSGKSQIAFSILGILPKEAVIVRGAVDFHGQNLLDPRHPEFIDLHTTVATEVPRTALLRVTHRF